MDFFFLKLFHFYLFVKDTEGLITVLDSLYKISFLSIYGNGKVNKMSGRDREFFKKEIQVIKFCKTL